MRFSTTGRSPWHVHGREEVGLLAAPGAESSGGRRNNFRQNELPARQVSVVVLRVVAVEVVGLVVVVAVVGLSESSFTFMHT